MWAGGEEGPGRCWEMFLRGQRLRHKLTVAKSIPSCLRASFPYL